MKPTSWSLQQLSIAPSSAAAPAISVAELEKIAQLAGLEVPAARIDQAHRDVCGMIAWCGQIKHVNTDGVTPMFTPLQQHEGGSLQMRPDAVSDGGNAAGVLKNAARKEGAYFVAPKMVDHDDS